MTLEVIEAGGGCATFGPMGTDDLFGILGRIGGLWNGPTAQALGIAIPEMLRDIVDGMEGFEFLSEPFREALTGLGGLGGVYRPQMVRTLGEVSGSVKELWDLGRGSALLDEVTKSIGSLQQFNPLKSG